MAQISTRTVTPSLNPTVVEALSLQFEKSKLTSQDVEKARAAIQRDGHTLEQQLRVARAQVDRTTMEFEGTKTKVHQQPRGATHEQSELLLARSKAYRAAVTHQSKLQRKKDALVKDRQEAESRAFDIFKEIQCLWFRARNGGLLLETNKNEHEPLFLEPPEPLRPSIPAPLGDKKSKKLEQSKPSSPPSLAKNNNIDPASLQQSSQALLSTFKTPDKRQAVKVRKDPKPSTLHSPEPTPPPAFVCPVKRDDGKTRALKQDIHIGKRVPQTAAENNEDKLESKIEENREVDQDRPDLVEAILQAEENVRVHQKQTVSIRQELEIHQLSYTSQLEHYAVEKRCTKDEVASAFGPEFITRGRKIFRRLSEAENACDAAIESAIAIGISWEALRYDDDDMDVDDDGNQNTNSKIIQDLKRKADVDDSYEDDRVRRWAEDPYCQAKYQKLRPDKDEAIDLFEYDIIHPSDSISLIEDDLEFQEGITSMKKEMMRQREEFERMIPNRENLPFADIVSDNFEYSSPYITSTWEKRWECRRRQVEARSRLRRNSL